MNIYPGFLYTAFIKDICMEMFQKADCAVCSGESAAVFGSMTTRNFFAMASASFTGKEKYERQEVMKLVQAELKRQITQENLEK